VGADSRTIEQPCPIHRKPLDSTNLSPFEGILCIVSTSPTPPQVGLLVLDDGAPGGKCAQTDLGLEGGDPTGPRHPDALAESKRGKWSLVLPM